MFRWLRWNLAKMRLVSRLGKHPPRHVKLATRWHRTKVEELPANAEGYGRLASVWNDYASWGSPGYGRFLASAQDDCGRPIQAVLELACGTGTLARRLAGRFESVVGLDASEAMIQQARSRTESTNVRYVRADFRDFSLNESFDAAVCGNDSLNYVEAPEELTGVFQCVERHLRPGGLFAFDVLNHETFLAHAFAKVVAEVSGERFEVYYFYDPKSRISEARAVFEGAVERHRRVPIEEWDVRRAARKARLEVVEHFSENHWPFCLVSHLSGRQFYVLRKP